jgi:hypothetical protein
MAEGSAARRDGFVAVRKTELIAAMAASAAPGETEELVSFCRILGALLNHEANEHLEAIKALYDPLDPDATPPRSDESPAAFEAFERAFVEALRRANFSEVEADAVQTREATKLLTDLSIKPSLDGIRRIRFFGRGAHPEVLTVKRLFKTHRVEADVLSDVVVLVGFESENEMHRRERGRFARARRGMRPGAALVKHFRNVASPELVTLHPGAMPSMRPRDQLFLAAPALAGGVPVLLNLWPALTVLGAVATTYFTAGQMLDNERLVHAVGALSGLVAVGAFVMRQRLKFEATTLRYHKRLADTVYFRNLANNTGVIDLLVGAGAEQDAKEAFLAYWALRRAGRLMTKIEVDQAAEAFLRERFGLDIDFEIHDALGKLERMGLVTHEGDNYSAVATSDALARLDAAWDGLFHFSAGQS